MSAKILVVDDEPQLERLILQRFRKQIRNEKYTFSFAQNGAEALEQITKAPDEVEIVLTDINMPYMDGLTLITRVRESFPEIKCVIISAYGDMRNIRKAMNNGAFDFLIKPIEFSDLETTIEKTYAEVKIAREALLARELKDKNVHLEEIDRMKSLFFTNISHEFRTPITVISGMADQIEEEPEKWLEEGLRMIRRNSRNLLDLINQILQLSKLEAGKIELKLKRGNIVNLTNYLSETFGALAAIRDIRLDYHCQHELIEMCFDSVMLSRILTNLLSNAVKYTPIGGSINFEVDKVGEHLKLLVSDSGPGIPGDHLPHIFERFYQGEANYQLSTGIGLSLVKELVQVMNGELQLVSDAESGTTFTILIPMLSEVDCPDMTVSHQENGLPFEQEPPEITVARQMEETVVVQDDLPSVLVVEDHEDVRNYVVAVLHGRYNVEVATDGMDGWEKALSLMPDLIISDVMMPQMDGFDLCEKLKTDPRTDHIPVILLTAKADHASRLEGLKHGADVYLAKPFEKKELHLRITKLLELRTKLREKYLVSEPVAEEIEPSPEDRFIRQLQSIITDNMQDENFGIQELCRAIGMSRTQLHRKIKFITGLSTSIYVRFLKLDQAKKILETSDMNVSQVAYEVGFRDPKYFSRVFIEKFGVPPIKFRG